MKRKYFKLPPHAALKNIADSEHQRGRSSVIRRTKFIFKLFGPPGRGMLFSGTMTAELYYEMINSYIFGLYLSTIFITHALFESVLSFGFILDSEDDIAHAGLGKITNELKARRLLSPELCNRIDELRAMRVAYFHAHVGLRQRGAMKRYLDNKNFGYQAHKQDAEAALKIFHAFLIETSPGFFNFDRVKNKSRPREKIIANLY